MERSLTHAASLHRAPDSPRAGRARRPQASAPRRGRRRALRPLQRTGDAAGLARSALQPPPACPGQPGGSCLAGEPRARRLVQRPVLGGSRRVRPVGGRVERAILALGDVGRVHLYRWGDGGAHFHVWFMPRPLGMLEASGMMLPLWEDVLPNVTDEELADAAKRVAAAL